MPSLISGVNGIVYSVTEKAEAFPSSTKEQFRNKIFDSDE